MKNLRHLLLYTIVALITFNTFSQSRENGKVLITGSRFTYPLVEKWLAEFKKKYPDVEARILPRRSASADSANLIINAHKLLPDEKKAGYETTNINRYVLLAISNSNNPLNEKFLKKGLKEEEIKELFFEKEIFEEEGRKSKKKEKEITPTIYTREEKACAPTAFANRYGYVQDNFKGNRISGDDKFLIYALKKDSFAITYNTPGYVYDLKTRKVQEGITVLPYDLNNNGKVEQDENFYSSLDQLIEKVENNNSTSLPIEYVNISYPKAINKDNKNLKLFLDFILTEGQKFNHEFGFLNNDFDYQANQKEASITRNKN